MSIDDIKVGDYVRNKYGIAKIIEIKEEYYTHKPLIIFDKDICFIKNNKTNEEPRINQIIIGDNIDINKININSNIINLIEIGDMVNGAIISKISKDNKGRKIFIWEYDTGEIQGEIAINEEDVKSIITEEQIEVIREQFKAMEYKIEK